MESTYLLSLALFLNALCFLPQAIKLYREKLLQSFSLLSVGVYLVIQVVGLWYGILYHDFGLLLSCLVAFFVSSALFFLIIRKQKNFLYCSKIPLETILDQVPGHIYWKDNNGVCVGCNTNNWRDFGLSSLADYIGKTDYDLFSHEEAEVLRASDQEVVKLGRLKVLEELVTTPDGKKTLYSSHKAPLRNRSNQIIGTLGISIDITESKREAIDRLNMLESIIAVMPGNVYWLNRDGVYLGCNDNEAKAVGMKSRKEIVGKRNIDIPGFVIPEVLDKVNDQVMKDNKAIVIEEPAILEDGSTAIFLSSKVPLHNNQGEVIGMVGISFDITDRKKAEIELKEAKEKAEAASKAKTQFLAVASHELRVPLTGILSVADMFANGMINKPDEVREYARIILDSGQYLLSNIDSILYFAKLESEKYIVQVEPIPIGVMLKKLVAAFVPMAHQKNLTLDIRIHENIPEVILADATALRHIVSNLISNAIRYTNEGWVKVDVTCRQKMANKIKLEIAVCDSGVGIPADKTSLIFDKFTQVEDAYVRKNSRSGFGLGLSIVKKFVDLLEGKIIVESKLGQGSCFRFRAEFMLPNDNSVMH